MSKEEINEYKELYSIVKKRLEQHNQSFTQEKQKILEVFFKSKGHLSLEEIQAELQSANKSIVSQSLSTLESLGILESIVIDEIKRFELIYHKRPHYHLYCQECHTITEFESLEIHDLFLKHLKDMDFKPTNFNVIINGICKECNKKN